MKITKLDVFSEMNRLAVAATTALERVMARFGVKRSEIADRLGIPRSRVTKVLDGEENITLKTLAAFGLACGVRWQLEAIDAEGSHIALDWPAFSFETNLSAHPGSEVSVQHSSMPAARASPAPGYCAALNAARNPLGPLRRRRLTLPYS